MDILQQEKVKSTVLHISLWVVYSVLLFASGLEK